MDLTSSKNILESLLWNRKIWSWYINTKILFLIETTPSILKHPPLMLNICLNLRALYQRPVVRRHFHTRKSFSLNEQICCSTCSFFIASSIAYWLVKKPIIKTFWKAFLHKIVFSNIDLSFDFRPMKKQTSETHVIPTTTFILASFAKDHILALSLNL